MAALGNFPLIQSLAVASGAPEFEAARETIFKEQFQDKVPEQYYLPRHFVDSPPKDVTGIPAQCGILTEEEIAITEKFDATALADAIRARRFTAVAVATAFAKRAIIAHQLTCCLTEWFMDEAIVQAQALDEHLASTGTVVGPLHGVPLSLKEHMPLAGHYSAAGYLSMRVKDNEDAHMVAIFRKLGAVFYCKTNQPQAIMHLESVSAYAGRVLNPHNIHLSAGGSTGGEAALIAMRGSVLGIGTDIGGSIRGPAGFCGIYGFKPTSYTMPMKDFLHGGALAELNILISAGPMCTSLRDLDLLMTAVLAEKPYLRDPRLIPIPWTGLLTVPKTSPLRIGFMMNDGAIQPQPPVTRALAWAQDRLRDFPARFLVRPFAPYRTAEAVRRIRLAYWPDGAKGVKEHLADAAEPMEPLTQDIIQSAEGPELTPSQIHGQRLQRDEFRCGFADHWSSQDVDVVICPTFVGPACAHNTALYWNYTAFWNYVDCPGVIVPTPVKALKRGEEDYAPGDSVPLSKECEHIRRLWAEGDFEGAPVTLQVVARKYHDNDLFAALNAMKDVLLLEG